jgi:hypothetical protein
VPRGLVLSSVWARSCRSLDTQLGEAGRLSRLAAPTPIVAAAEPGAGPSLRIIGATRRQLRILGSGRPVYSLGPWVFGPILGFCELRDIFLATTTDCTRVRPLTQLMGVPPPAGTGTFDGWAGRFALYQDRCRTDSQPDLQS